MSKKATLEENRLIEYAKMMNQIKQCPTAHAQNSQRQLERRPGHYSTKRYNLPDNASAARR